MEEGLPDATGFILDLICGKPWAIQGGQGTAGGKKNALATLGEGITNDSFLDLDPTFEVAAKHVASRLRGFPLVGKLDEAKEAVREAFERGRMPALTLFEICSMIGSKELLDRLQELAQQKLCRHIYSQDASIERILRLLRAGASPQRQHFQAWLLRRSYEEDFVEPVPKRRRLEESHSSTSLPLPPGTALHWVCRVGTQLPKSRGNLSSRYAEVASWLADIAPYSLLLADDKGRTPVQVVLAAMPSEGGGEKGSQSSTALCAMCGMRGHVGKDCPSIDDASDCEERNAAVALSLLKVLGERFATVVDRYPWRLAALLSSSKNAFRKDIERARSLLITLPAVPTAAVEGFNQALASSDEAREVPASAGEIQPGELAAEAVEKLGSLSAARSRARLVKRLHSTFTQEWEAMELDEAKAKLQESETARRQEVEDLEQRLESAEAKLAEAQRRVEEAEAAAAATPAFTLPSSTQPASAAEPAGKRRQTGTPARQQSSATAASESSPEAFINDIRRERLVDLEDLEEAAPDVRAGVASLCRSLCAAVERLAEDLYESECHFIYELVQNAEDAHRRSDSRSVTPTLRLKLGSSEGYPEYFMSDNNEAGFTQADIRAICDISASSKKRQSGDAKEQVIGCKGIGFKSVFTVSDQPHVLSNGYTFVFNVTGPLGKLGYVTPTWLTADDLDQLPAEVREAHAAGRTVLFLPLKRRGLASAIGREMDELLGPGRATVLFLQRLRTIELVSQASSGKVLRRTGVQTGDGQANAIVAELPGETKTASTEEFPYLVHHHRIPQGPAQGCVLVLAFPLLPPSEGDEGAIRLEPLFCSLPIRAIGFGFAIHCDGFNLVANRADLHHGSVVNRAIRDAVAEAYAAACSQHQDVAARALSLLGEPVADAFWRVAREGILARLSSVACVRTDDDSTCKPTAVLIKGIGKMREAAELLPASLVSRACGRSFARTASTAEERLLRRLGAEEFGLSHFCQCLAHQSDEYPQGWVAKLWAEEPRASALSTIAVVYSCLSTMALEVAPGHAGQQNNHMGAPRLDAMLGLPSLSIFPLQSLGCSSLSSGRIFRGMSKEVSQRWQRALAEGRVLRVLSEDVADVLDAAAHKLLEALGIVAASREDIVVCVLESHLTMVLGSKAANPAVGQQASERGLFRWRESLPSAVTLAFWAGLGVLRDEWLKAKDGDASPGVLEKALSQVCCQAPSASLADFIRLPVRAVGLQSSTTPAMLPPNQLYCPTLLGKQGVLPHDLVARVEAFIGTSTMSQSSRTAVREVTEVTSVVGAAGRLGAPLERWPDDFHDRPLAWEAFLVDGLGVQPLVPMDPRQPRAPPDLKLFLGAAFGSDTDFGFWRTLLNEDMTAAKAFAYAIRRLQSPIDVAFFRQLPTRGGAEQTLKLQDLFLASTFLPIAGTALESAYLNLPEAAGTTGRGPMLLQAMRAVGIRCDADLPCIQAAVSALVQRRCRDVSPFARLYMAAATAEEGLDENNLSIDAQQAKAVLRMAIFHPLHKAPLKAKDCVWAGHSCKLLARCSPLIPLEEVYAPYGSRRLEQYFVGCRGVQVRLCTAAGYLGLLNSIWETAELLGRYWRTVAPMGENVTVPLKGAGAAGGTQSEEKIGALDFLDTVWESLLQVYKGMSQLPDEEKAALKPFSDLEPLVLVPLNCPAGGPPHIPSMCGVAHFCDGATFRRLPIAEAFWEVTPDLAHSRIAEWALSNFFPAELRGLFVDHLGAREAVDLDALRQGLRSSSVGNFGRPNRRSSFTSAGPTDQGAFNRQPVNESGLPADVVDGAGLPGNLGDADHDAVHRGGTLRNAAEAAIELLRDDDTRGSRRVERRDAEHVRPQALHAAATPARSVRCPPTRAKQLVPHGTVSFEDNNGSALQLYVIMDATPATGSRQNPAVAALERFTARDVRRLDLGGLARVLVRLAERVFDVPRSRIALATELPGFEDDSSGACSHTVAGASWNVHWPLLFSAKLRVQAGEDPEFWFGEFCHALAHRSLGQTHSAEHTWVQQLLMSKYMQDFLRAFHRRR